MVVITKVDNFFFLFAQYTFKSLKLDLDDINNMSNFQWENLKSHGTMTISNGKF